MIEKCQSFKIGDKVFATLEEAQVHALACIVEDVSAKAIVDHKDEVIDILTMTPNARPRARKANGGTKKRTRGLPSSANAVVQDTKP